MIDPYLHWLGIPAESRPPTLYQLLDLPPYERDPQTILAGAQRQMDRLMPHTAGPLAAHAQALLSQVAHARATLLDPTLRSTYEQQLAAHLQQTAAPAHHHAAFAPEAHHEDLAELSPVRRRRKPSSGGGMVMGAVVAGVAGVAALGLLGFVALNKKPSEKAAEAEPPTTITVVKKAETPKPAVKGPLMEPARRVVKVSADAPKEMADGSRVHTGHADAVQGVAVSPDGKRLLSGGRDESVLLWDIDKQHPVAKWAIGSPVAAVAFHPDGVRAFCCDETDAFLLNINDPKAATVRFRGPAGRIVCLAVSPDGNSLLTGHTDGSLRLWDTSSGQMRKEYNVSGNLSVTGAAFTKDGSVVVAGCADGTLTTYDLTSARRLQRWNAHKNGIISLAASSDGRRLVSSGGDGRAVVWDSATGRQLTEFTGHRGPVLAVRFLPGNQHVLSGGADKTIWLWDTVTAKPIVSHTAASQVAAVDASGASDQVIAFAAGSEVLARDLESSQQPVAVKPPPAPAGKQPRPDDAALAAAEKQVRMAYMAALESEDPNELRETAKMLLKRSGDTTEPPPMQFALAQTAIEAAVKAGEAALVVSVIDTLATRFELDVEPLKVKALGELAATNFDADAGVVIVQTALLQVAILDATERFDLSGQLLATAANVAEKINVPGLVKLVADVRHDHDKAETDHKDAVAGVETLKSNPDDPAANTAVGKRLCLVLRNWTAGLPLLAKGNDADLAELAKSDLAMPTTAADRLKVGDGWWDLAKAVPGGHRWSARLRARHWYEQALPDLTGIEKLNVDGRIRDTEQPVTGGTEAMPTPTLTPRKPGEMVWASYNTLGNPRTWQREWQANGRHQIMQQGIVLYGGGGADAGELISKFKLLDGTKTTIGVRSNARGLFVTICGERIDVRGMPGQQAIVTIERQGPKLSFSVKSGSSKPETFTVGLADEATAMAPSPLVISTREEGAGNAMIASVVVTGSVMHD